MADLQDISRNWATRPGDERLKSLDELQAVTLAAKSIARVGEAKLRDLRVNATDSGLMLTGKAGIPVAPSKSRRCCCTWSTATPSMWCLRLSTFASGRSDRGRGCK